MYCSECGAYAQREDVYCPKCGKLLKHRSEATESVSPERNDKKKYSAAPLIITLLLLVAAGSIIAFVVARGYIENYLRELLPNGQTVSEAHVAASGADATTGTTATTDAIGTTTTSTTRTTATTENQKKREAEMIREMLLSAKWKTTIEGYEAIVTFQKGGAAVITVKVKIGFFTVNKSIDAEYSVSDKCHAYIVGEYDGNSYGISGYIERVSDSELIIERDKNLGKVTLKKA